MPRKAWSTVLRANRNDLHRQLHCAGLRGLSGYQKRTSVRYRDRRLNARNSPATARQSANGVEIVIEGLVLRDKSSNLGRVRADQYE